MNNKVKALIFSLCAGLCLSGVSFAETIVLKSGKIVEGKIVNKTNEYTEVDFMGVKIKYFNDQIAEIKNNEPAAVSSSAASNSETGLISIKIKGSEADSSKKAENITECIKRLDSANSKMDSLVAQRMTQAIDVNSPKMTDQQYSSLQNIIGELKVRADEVEKMQPPQACKTLKDIFLKKCRARISGVEELLAGRLPPGEVTRMVEKQNKEAEEISKKYNEERQRIIKANDIKL